MGKIRVMLADDQVLLREGLKTIINLQENMEVVAEAGDGTEAIEKLSDTPVDVILMDIRMPKLNGIEATVRIKQDYPDTAIIVLTTFNEESLVIDALAGGADGYLLKDIDAEHLIKAIEDANSGDMLLPVKVAASLAGRLSGRKSSGCSNFGTGMVEALTDREKEIGLLIAGGMSNRQIADKLFLSEGTVKNYISTLYSKLGTNNRAKVGIMIQDMLD